MKHRLGAFVLGLLIIGASVISSVAYAAPTFEWTPKSLTQTVGVGEIKTVAVTFTASQNANNGSIRYVKGGLRHDRSQ